MTKAMIIVDVQNDFVEGGALGVDGGKKVGTRIINILKNTREYDLIITTQDWHIEPEGHFAKEPDFIDTWPVHCVANTVGAEIITPLADFLETQSIPVIPFKKGEYDAAYSGFEAKNNKGQLLAQYLKEQDITEIEVVGIATDYCVKATAEDAITNGFKTAIIRNAVAGIHAENVEILMNETFPNNNITIR